MTMDGCEAHELKLGGVGGDGGCLVPRGAGRGKLAEACGQSNSTACDENGGQVLE